MREDKLPELGANDPIIPHPSGILLGDLKPFLYLIRPSSQELKLYKGHCCTFWN